MKHEIAIDLHVSQVGKTLEAEAGTGTEPDLGEVDSFPTRLLNQLHLMVVLKWQKKLENDHVHLLGGPLHEELIELPVEEEEGTGEAKGGQQVVLLLCH